MNIEHLREAAKLLAALSAELHSKNEGGDIRFRGVKERKDMADEIAKISDYLNSMASLDGATGLSMAAFDILAERRRQVEAEGWSAEHDDGYRDNELPRAAYTYILYTVVQRNGAATPVDLTTMPITWPWGEKFWKPSDERRNLVKASALILAEIERLDRAVAAQRGAHG